MASERTALVTECDVESVPFVPLMGPPAFSIASADMLAWTMLEIAVDKNNTRGNAIDDLRERYSRRSFLLEEPADGNGAPKVGCDEPHGGQRVVRYFAEILVDAEGNRAKGAGIPHECNADDVVKPARETHLAEPWIGKPGPAWRRPRLDDGFLERIARHPLRPSPDVQHSGSVAWGLFNPLLVHACRHMQLQIRGPQVVHRQDRGRAADLPEHRRERGVPFLAVKNAVVDRADEVRQTLRAGKSHGFFDPNDVQKY